MAMVDGAFYGPFLAKLRSGLQERLGQEMRIDLELVNEIPREKSGKYRWVISRVDHSNLVDWEASPPEGQESEGTTTRPGAGS